MLLLFVFLFSVAFIRTWLSVITLSHVSLVPVLCFLFSRIVIYSLKSAYYEDVFGFCRFLWLRTEIWVRMAVRCWRASRYSTVGTTTMLLWMVSYLTLSFSRCCTESIHNALVWRHVCNTHFTIFESLFCADNFQVYRKLGGIWKQRLLLHVGTRICGYCFLFTSLSIPTIWKHCFLPLASLNFVFRAISGMVMLCWW